MALDVNLPTYEYECENKHRFEVWQSMKDDSLKECPTCGSPVHRILHPAGIIFKGSGWYITDSRKGGSADGEAKSKAKADSDKAAAKSDAKAESKPDAKNGDASAKDSPKAGDKSADSSAKSSSSASDS